MRALPMTMLIAFLLPLAACPAPEDAPTAQPAPGPAPGDAPPPAADGAPTAPPSGALPTAIADPVPTEGPVAPVPPPGLASLIKDGKSVTLSGTLKGATSAHIDIAAATTEGAPEVLEVVEVKDGTFTVKAPANYPRDLYISAVVTSSGAPAPTDPGGMAGPITLAGKDVAVEITVSKDTAWQKKLPWYRAVAEPMPTGAVGTPAGPPLDAAAAAAGVAPPAPMPAGTPALGDAPPKPASP